MCLDAKPVILNSGVNYNNKSSSFATLIFGLDASITHTLLFVNWRVIIVPCLTSDHCASHNECHCTSPDEYHCNSPDECHGTSPEE